MQKNGIIYCNKCGRKIREEGKLPEGEELHVEKNWGYFSKKDGEIHKFDLCEACYGEWCEGFSIPVEKEETTVYV